MALTDTQKQKVLLYLGWPGKTLVSTSTHYSATVAARLTLLTSDIETNAVACLTALDALALKFTAATARALVKKVGDIELNSEEHPQLNKEHRRQQRLLSGILDIPVVGGQSRNIGIVI